MLSALARRVLDAYGGESLWRSARAVEATVTARGLAFLAKGRSGLHEVRVHASLDRPRAVLYPFSGQGRQAVVDAESVRIENADGDVVASRADPRRLFPGGRRTVYWDRLDVAYFAGYAAWNYLAFPALLLREDIEWRELSDTALEARFPPRIPTHCERQLFHIDPASGLLQQHDYTAEVFGEWARAANVVLQHEAAEPIPFGPALLYPSRRRVTPRRPDGSARPFPLLVGILFRDWSVDIDREVYGRLSSAETRSERP
jgi:hypothetical protein